MLCRKILLPIAAAGVVVAAFTPPEASANGRARAVRAVENGGLSPADFCGGRFPAYGFDACGYREVSHGPDSCWRRLPHKAYGPHPPRRVRTCG